MANEVVKRESTSVAIAAPRLPYHPLAQERFGVGPGEWRALTDAIFPSAKTTEAVILALSWCKAKRRDPFKKCVHIVPIWDKERGCMVETVWPGIAEYRITACETREYAGHDETSFGPNVTTKLGNTQINHPEWAQMTVYRLVQGVRCAFPGPKVYWLETYASKKDGSPNQMWTDRPIGMIEKCAEAAALRSAFPDEFGGELTAEECRGEWHGRPCVTIPAAKPKTAALLEAPQPAHVEEMQEDIADFQQTEDAVEVIEAAKPAKDKPKHWKKPEEPDNFFATDMREAGEEG